MLVSIIIAAITNTTHITCITCITKAATTTTTTTSSRFMIKFVTLSFIFIFFFIFIIIDIILWLSLAGPESVSSVLASFYFVSPLLHLHVLYHHLQLVHRLVHRIQIQLDHRLLLYHHFGPLHYCRLLLIIK